MCSDPDLGKIRLQARDLDEARGRKTRQDAVREMQSGKGGGQRVRRWG